MGDALDAELGDFINKLNGIQSKLGNAKARAGLVGDDGKVDRFSELKLNMSEKLSEIRQLLEASKKAEGATQGGAKDAIEAQSKIRSQLQAVSDEWAELDRVWQTEARKRKSKYSIEELERRRQIVVDMQSEIQSIKDFQRAGFVKGYQATNMVAMADSEMFKGADLRSPGAPKSSGVYGRRNNDMTDQHRTQLHLLKERDMQIDKEIELIGTGVDELKVIAQAQNQEVRLQNRMLDQLESKIGDVQDHMITLNEKLKNTLEESRSSDKICVDIFCILIMIGLISVLVSLTKKGG